MVLSQSQIDEFHLRGFVKGPKVVDDATVEHLRDELQAVMESRAKNQPVAINGMQDSKQATEYGQNSDPKKVVVQIVNIWEASDAFLAHARNPLITEAVSRLCNNTPLLRIWHDQIQYKPSRVGGSTCWHQDFPGWPILQPADLISAWVALDDAELDNGAMWMVPGSHRWGKIQTWSGENFVDPKCEPALLPEGVEVKAEPVLVKKGEVAFHHCMTWHCSPENKSDRPRRAIAVHYMPGYTIYVQGKHVVAKHVTVKPGEILAGEKFPVVYERVLQTA